MEELRGYFAVHSQGLGHATRAVALARGVMERRQDLYLLFLAGSPALEDRKSTRLNSSHLVISYAVFCLKKKKQPINLRFPRVIQLDNIHLAIRVDKTL